MSQAHLSGFRVLSSSDKTGIRNGMVRGPEGAHCNKSHAFGH